MKKRKEGKNTGESGDEDSSPKGKGKGKAKEKPKVSTPTKTKIAIIVNCVDNSGRWGSGGVFSSLDKLSPFIGARYEEAGQNDDLQLGDVHLEKLEDLESIKGENNIWVANVVAQKRDKKGNLSAVQLNALEEGLKKISHTAKKKHASVHLPRIGQTSPNFNWYGTERLIRKWLCAKGIPTYIYYYPRKRKSWHGGHGQSQHTAQTTAGVDDESPVPVSRSKTSHEEQLDREQSPPILQLEKRRKTQIEYVPESSATLSLPFNESPLANIFTGLVIYFGKHVSQEEVHRFTRKIIAFDGDVSDTLQQNITHIICPEDMIGDDILDHIKQFPNIPVVTLLWVNDSIVAKQLMPVEPYSQ